MATLGEEHCLTEDGQAVAHEFKRLTKRVTSLRGKHD